MLRACGQLTTENSNLGAPAESLATHLCKLHAENVSLREVNTLRILLHNSRNGNACADQSVIQGRVCAFLRGALSNL